MKKVVFKDEVTPGVAAVGMEVAGTLFEGFCGHPDKGWYVQID